MNNKKHIEELESVIEHIKAEPIKGWIHKVSKLIKVKKIEKKIRELKKKR